MVVENGRSRLIRSTCDQSQFSTKLFPSDSEGTRVQDIPRQTGEADTFPFRKVGNRTAWTILSMRLLQKA